MGTIQYRRGHQPTPDTFTAKLAFFSREKSIPGNSTDCFELFLESLQLLIGTSYVFFCIVFPASMDKSFRLSRRRAESVRRFRN